MIVRKFEVFKTADLKNNYENNEWEKSFKKFYFTSFNSFKYINKKKWPLFKYII